MSLTIQSGGSLTIQGGGGGGGGGATVGTYANRPAAGNAGALYICTDSPIAQWVDDGSAWRPMILGQALGTQVPAASAFTAFGGGSFQKSDNNGTIDFSATGDGSRGLCGGVIAASGSSLFAEAAVSQYREGDGTNCEPQVFLRESSTGKSVGINFQMLNSLSNYRLFGMTFSGDVQTSEATASAKILAMYSPANVGVIGRVRVSGTNVICEFSYNRVKWMHLYTYSVASVFSTSPNQVGFGYIKYNTGGGNLVHFKYGSL